MKKKTPHPAFHERLGICQICYWKRGLSPSFIFSLVEDYGPEKDTGWQNFTNQSGLGRIVQEISQRRATRKLHLQYATNYHCGKKIEKLSNCHPNVLVDGHVSSETCKANSDSQLFFLENRKGNIVFNERPKPCLQSTSLTIFYLILVTSLKRRFAFNIFEDRNLFPFWTNLCTIMRKHDGNMCFFLK